MGLRSAVSLMRRSDPQCRQRWSGGRLLRATSAWSNARHASTGAHRQLHPSGNIVLMGPPGAGKTSVGSCLAQLLSLKHLDVDNDHLENVWGCPVAKKLGEVGGERFVVEEGLATMQLRPDITNTVISLSGSNPLHRQAMDHIHALGLVVYLDVDQQDILRRLQAMKVNRIVGQTDGISMDEILEFRRHFYERSYQVRAIIPTGSGVQDCANVVMETLENHRNLEAGYTSTRSASGTESVDLSDVVLSGLAADGGLYVPRFPIPKLSPGQWRRLTHLSFQERAVRILEHWLPATSVPRTKLSKMVDVAYSTFQHPAVAPVATLSSSPLPGQRRLFLQELFWGPTASFKDLPLQLMPQLLRHFAGGKDYALVVATSGDTGSAALHGFGSHTDYPVIVFYPEHGVSRSQRQQMTSLASRFPRCRAIGVDGDFDFCQSSVKSMFADVEWRRELREDTGVHLNAANSINWMRLLPQVIHHTSAYLDLVQHGHVAMGDPVDLCIPTGNFGNAMAAIYAKRMGVPFGHIHIASNANNVLEEFIATGVYNVRDRSLVRTISPAIDILVSSNVERLLHLVAQESGDDACMDWARHAFSDLRSQQCVTAPAQVMHRIRDLVQSRSVSEEECRRAIRDVVKDTGYFPDPHTAVALDGFHSDRHAPGLHGDRPVIISSTAHFEKFTDDVVASAGLTDDVIRQSGRYTQHECLAQSLVEFKDSDVVTCKAALAEMKATVTAVLRRQ